ncbi:MAG: hypothetical protein ABIK09_06905 [Pseudomonadota bacterium]
MVIVGGPPGSKVVREPCLPLLDGIPEPLRSEIRQALLDAMA